MNGRLPQRNQVFLLGHLAGRLVEHLVLDEQDGVVVADGRLQQALGVVGRRGHDDEDARRVAEPRLQALAVVGGDAPAGPALGPKDHRHGRLAPEHVAVLGGLVDELVHRQGHEIDIHDFGDRSHAAHGRADGRPRDGLLADGRVADPLLAELLQQALRGPVGAAVDGHVFAHDEDALVPPHLLGQGVANRLAIHDDGHDGHSLGSMRTRPFSVSIQPQ